jgi:hypothetical protein
LKRSCLALACGLLSCPLALERRPLLCCLERDSHSLLHRLPGCNRLREHRSSSQLVALQLRLLLSFGRFSRQRRLALLRLELLRFSKLGSSALRSGSLVCITRRLLLACRFGVPLHLLHDHRRPRGAPGTFHQPGARRRPKKAEEV